MINLNELTIKKAGEDLRLGKYKVIDLVNAYKKVIEEKDGNINAYLEVFSDLEAQAEKAQKMIDDGSGDLMTGIPIAVKDNILIDGRIASSASKILENYKATYSATVIQKLDDVSSVYLGRTNMDEFAQGASTENSAYGITKNPHDETRVSGGSSGGSVAAVAMDGALCALGSDTGGSIRQPAGFCGVVGLKPTYGSVSRHGLMAMASSLDVIGPITKTVEDAEIFFNAIKGKDILDSTTTAGDSYRQVKKIGVPMSYLKEGVDEDVIKNFEDSLDKLKKEGYEILDIDIPNIQYAVPVYYILVPAEVSSNMARYDGVKYGEKVEGKDMLEDYFKTRGNLLGKEVKRRIMLGTYILSSGYSDKYYYKALEVRDKMTEGVKKVFEQVDLIALPTSPTPAFKIGEKTNDPVQMYLADVFTSFANLTGIPAISIPSGFTEREGKSLPLSLQLFAPHHGEKMLFELGKKFEIIK